MNSRFGPELSRRSLIKSSTLTVGALAAANALPFPHSPSAHAAPGLATASRLGQLAVVAEALQDSRTAVEAVQLNWDDMGPSPQRWTTQGIAAPLALFFWWGYIRLPDRRPILLVRLMTQAGTLEVVHGETGDGVFGRQSPLQPTGFGGFAEYRAVTGDPEGFTDDPTTWEMAGSSPRMLYRTSSKRSRVIEGDFFDTTWDYMPSTMCITPPGALAPYFSGAATVHGTYLGTPVRYTGGFDRMYGIGAIDFLTSSPFIYLAFSGVGFDGRREWGAVFITGDKGAGMYCRDGDSPVTSTEVQLEAQYVRDPANPSRISPSRAIFRFADKEIQYVAKHGAAVTNHHDLLTSVYPIVNTEGNWRERNSPTQFAQWMGSIESHIPEGSVQI
ncbi:twin-arginine translocation signal domain-containing protein [Nocardia asteroides]|uniref:twin-arginine translocation signal domain-containing protein n=1 Tax=Nocardia asteroides TaxID=1824 RepID=UPI0037CAED96